MADRCCYSEDIVNDVLRARPVYEKAIVMVMDAVASLALLVVILAMVSPLLRYVFNAKFGAIALILVGISAIWGLFAMGGFAAMLALM